MKDIATLTAQLAEAPAADKPGIQAQIDAKNAIVADLNTKLPPVGNESTALMNQLSTEVNMLNRQISMLDAYRQLNGAFNFEADGSVAAGSKAITDEKKKMLNEAYIFSSPRLTPSGSASLTGIISSRRSVRSRPLRSLWPTRASRTTSERPSACPPPP